MTYEEAIKVLSAESCYECSYGCNSPTTCGNPYCIVKEATVLAIASLEKQIPKKPNSGVDRTWGTPTKEALCPACDYSLGHWEFIGGVEEITYCENCGQAISWEGWKWTD